MKNIHNALIIDHITRRIDVNKNALILAVGDTGSGKSYGTMRFLEKSCSRFDIKFSAAHIHFKVHDFMKDIQMNHKPGTGIMFDEAGVSINARKWQSQLNILMSYVLQTFRFKNYIVGFTVPDLSFIDVHARKLFHYIMDTRGIDYNKKISKFSFKRLQTNRNTGKIYIKCIRAKKNGGYTKIPFFKAKLPSSKLIEEYEAKRKKYINQLYIDLEEEQTKNTRKKIPKNRAICSKCNYEYETRTEKPVKCPQCQGRGCVDILLPQPSGEL